MLVHGAWADATGFDAEIRALQGRGYRAIGFANPLRDLAGDAAYLAEFLRTLTGPIVLVGHSYGGNVISMAAIGNDQVQALVYFNGWMCDEGESQQQLLEQFEGSLVGPSIRPVPYTDPDGSEGTDLFLDPEAFREAFAADVDSETAAVMAAAQRPYAAAAFAAAPSGPPAWKTLPCWYLLGTEDKAIPPALQRFMAERANATIVEVAASHVSFVSQPEAATQLILQAIEATATPGNRSRQGGVRLTATGLERGRRAALVAGASFSHRAQGGGIWPVGAGMPDPQPKHSTNQSGSSAGHGRRPHAWPTSLALSLACGALSACQPRCPPSRWSKGRAVRPARHLRGMTPAMPRHADSPS